MSGTRYTAISTRTHGPWSLAGGVVSHFAVKERDLLRWCSGLQHQTPVEEDLVTGPGLGQSLALREMGLVAQIIRVDKVSGMFSKHFNIFTQHSSRGINR